MKKILIFIISLFVLNTVYATDLMFNATMSILSAMSVSETSPLSFPARESLGIQQIVTVLPTDTGAAVFSITGGNPGSTVTVVIAEVAGINMSNAGNDILVDNWQYGGSLSALGVGTLDGAGALTGLAIGADATVPGSTPTNLYTGTATFRITYQ